MGHVILTVLGMVAEMERRFIKERQRDGIDRAKNKGVYKGGKQRIDRPTVWKLHGSGASVSNIARRMQCSRMQIYRILQGPER